MSVSDNIARIRRTIPDGVTLVCVSKFHPAEAIREAYEVGERDFGESRVQELCRKHETLPDDIRWHMIGHLQTNKVRDIVPFVHLIHSVDSIHLMEVIHRESERIGRVTNILLEVHIAREQSKSGFSPDELPAAIEAAERMPYLHIAGIMSMATNTDDEQEIRRCFDTAHHLLSTLPNQTDSPLELSIGMSDDYLIAMSEGSTIVRIGTAIFGSRL